MSLFEVFPSLCAKSHPFWWLSVETRFRGCHPNFFQLLVGHTKQPVFANVPSLVPVQHHEQPPEPLTQSLRSRSVATLDPFRSSRQIHVGDVSRRSAVSGFLHSSSFVLELCAPSSPGGFSCRIGLASNFSAPRTGCVTLFRFDYGEGSFFGE